LTFFFKVEYSKKTVMPARIAPWIERPPCHNLKISDGFFE
jgi:hypothetical protein